MPSCFLGHISTSVNGCIRKRISAVFSTREYKLDILIKKRKKRKKIKRKKNWMGWSKEKKQCSLNFKYCRPKPNGQCLWVYPRREFYKFIYLVFKRHRTDSRILAKQSPPRTQLFHKITQDFLRFSEYLDNTWIKVLKI